MFPIHKAVCPDISGFTSCNSYIQWICKIKISLVASLHQKTQLLLVIVHQLATCSKIVRKISALIYTNSQSIRLHRRVAVVMCSKFQACGSSPAEIVGSNSITGHGCLSLESVMSGLVEVSAMSWSLVQRSSTECGASLCVIYKPNKWAGRGPRWAAALQEITNIYILYNTTWHSGFL
jgi:hypothetical protein